MHDAFAVTCETQREGELDASFVYTYRIAINWFYGM